jgi:hypothetical protein
MTLQSAEFFSNFSEKKREKTPQIMTLQSAEFFSNFSEKKKGKNSADHVPPICGVFF